MKEKIEKNEDQYKEEKFIFEDRDKSPGPNNFPGEIYQILI